MPALHLKHGERGSFPASRRARRNCLKVAGPAGKKLRVKKTASFGKSLVLNGCGKFISRIWQIILHETDYGEVMKMQAHYTDPLKPARPPHPSPHPLNINLDFGLREPLCPLTSVREKAETQQNPTDPDTCGASARARAHVEQRITNG